MSFGVIFLLTLCVLAVVMISKLSKKIGMFVAIIILFFVLGNVLAGLGTYNPTFY